MLDVVRDVDGPLGLALWRGLRDVRLWAGVPAGEREGRPPTPEVTARLDEAAAQAPELDRALATFARLAEAPGEADARGVAEACVDAFTWAEAGYLLPVAVCFAEAAALAEPDDPVHANRAGRICRRAALHDRAVEWYRRAFRLAVWKGDREESLSAQLGHGRVLLDMGKHVEARPIFVKAARRAVRTGRRSKAGAAHHELLGIAAEVGTLLEGEHHTRQALDLYPRRHPRIPALAHDYSFLLLKSHHYRAALSILERVLPKVRGADRALLLGTLARAAACAGRKDQFDDAREQVIFLTGAMEEVAAAVLVNLAEGARAFSEWEEAAKYARLAVEIAQRRKDGEAEKAARGLLADLSSRNPSTPEADPPPSSAVLRLTRALTTRMEGR